MLLLLSLFPTQGDGSNALFDEESDTEEDGLGRTVESIIKKLENTKVMRYFGGKNDKLIWCLCIFKH